VLGSGVSGRAAARLARRLGHRVTVHEPDPGRAAELGAGGLAPDVAVAAGAWDASLLHGIDLVVASPGIPERAVAVTDTFEAGIPLWSEIELAWRHLGVPTVAVTGTNGKTTVTTLISQILTEGGVRAPALGNIGDPLADAVGTDVEVAVVEVSSFQLRFTERFRPDVAVVTNVAPDHLDWHGDFGRYLEAKARIVAAQTAEDVMVYDVDDEGAARVAARAPGRTVGASGCNVSPDGYGPDAGRRSLRLGPADMPLDGVPVADPAFLSDIALAAAAAVQIGGKAEAIVDVVRRFTPGRHRRSVVAERAGVTFVDDSKATNPHAALAAVRSYPSVVLIAGGIDKGLDLRPLAWEERVRVVVAIGTAAPVLLEAAGDRGIAAASMEQAVVAAAAVARTGDVVLLAPGCSSFDMFDSYAHRGDAFAAAVGRLGQEVTS
jgi:UDP-N-acetylmuramoylalanine--D-glutamate ligase